MVYFDSAKIMECIDVESVTSETVTFNVDGERLLNEIYEDIKIELDDTESNQIILRCQDRPFIYIHQNKIFDEDNCRQLAIEVMNRINSQIRSKLNLK